MYRRGSLVLIKRVVIVGLAVLLTAVLAGVPRVAFAAGMVRVSGTLSDARSDTIGGVTVYATAPGSSTVLYGPTISDPFGNYVLSVAPGTYDMHFVPDNAGWEAGVAGDVKSSVTVSAAQTINDVLSYKQVSSPVAFAELRCGGEGVPAAANFFTLLLNGGYGFPAGVSVTTTLYPGGYNLGSGRTPSNGFYFGGSIGGSIGTATQLSSFQLAPGDYSLTFSAPGVDNPPSVPFTVPNSCPLFSTDVTPAVADNNVISGQPFPLAILSSATFDAPARVDVSSLRFGVGSGHLLDGLPVQHCDPPLDINGDGLNDLLCYVTATYSAPGHYLTELTGRTLDEGSSPNGFLFTQNQSVDLGIRLTISNPGASQPQLTWNAVDGTDHYDVYRNSQLIGSSPAAAFTDTTLTGTGDYLYYVVPVQADGTVGDASTIAEDVITSFLTAPTGLTAVSPTNNAPVLTWDAEAAATGYRIYRQDTASGITAQVGASLSNNFTDSYVPGVYNYTVVAVDAAGNVSAASAPVQVAVTNTANTNSRNIMAQGQTEVIPVVGSDVLPGLVTGSTVKATFDFNVGYPGGIFTVKRPLTFTFASGGHMLFVSSTSVDWLVVDGSNNSRGTFQGMANVTLDGTATNRPFTVSAIDGSLTSPATADRFKLTVYTDNTRSTVLYSVDESLSKGKIKIN